MQKNGGAKRKKKKKLCIRQQYTSMVSETWGISNSILHSLALPVRPLKTTSEGSQTRNAPEPKSVAQPWHDLRSKCVERLDDDADISQRGKRKSS